MMVQSPETSEENGTLELKGWHQQQKRYCRARHDPLMADPSPFPVPCDVGTSADLKCADILPLLPAISAYHVLCTRRERIESR